MPLVRSFWLGKKKEKERYVIPIPEGKRVRFEIGGPTGIPREGTVSSTGAVCLLCSTPVSLSYLREEGKAGRMGSQLMAIAAEGRRQRNYLPPTEEHEKAGDVPRPDDIPDAEIARNPRYLTAPNYGMRTWGDLFTNRQLTALTILSDIISEVHNSVSAAHPAYADSIVTYLSLALSRITSTNSQLCRWRSDAAKESVNDTFSRQALPMVWDFAEGYPFADGPSSYSWSASWIARTLDFLESDVIPGLAQQEDAAKGDYDGRLLVATDPPYYDNIGYSDLSDFFYVWLRRSLIDVYPDLMQMVLTPKDDEIVADPFRHGGKEQAKQFFEECFEAVFSRISKGTPKGYPISFFYAYKQTERDSDKNQASTGWETLLEAMLKTGWTVTGTWPIRTELGNRPRGQDSNALASSIVLACRPRPAAASVTDRRGLVAALRAEMPGALRKLEQGGVAPVDLRQAAIGPGMAIYSRYAHVNEPAGGKMRVRSALALINQVLDEWLSQMEGDVTADTRWCVEWYKEHGFDPGPFGDADTLSKGTDTGVAVLDRAGVLHARAGKVTLLSIDKISNGYDASRDDRISEWKVCLHLAKRLREQGTEPAAQLMARVRDKIDLRAVRDLAYLLYSKADENDWSDTALIFNALGTSWPELDFVSTRV